MILMSGFRLLNVRFPPAGLFEPVVCGQDVPPELCQIRHLDRALPHLRLASKNAVVGGGVEKIEKRIIS